MPITFFFLRDRAAVQNPARPRIRGSPLTLAHGDHGTVTPPPPPPFDIDTNLAEYGVLLVEMRRVVQGEEKLALVGARLVLIRHRYLAAMVELDPRVYLVPEGLAVYARPAIALAGRIAPLNHELPNDAVKHRVVVVLRNMKTTSFGKTASEHSRT